MIAILNYGMGNLRNVQKAIEYVGAKAEITSDADRIMRAERLVLPGVGAFRDAVNMLRDSRLDVCCMDFAKTGKPVMGICLGMQLLFERSFEFGVFFGLGLVDGDISLMQTALKVPHIGWNQVRVKKDSPLLQGLDGEDFYFVHSYAAGGSTPSAVGVTEYGVVFASVVQKGNVYGAQFHPEKSGEAGLQMWENFVKL